jgi:hypothetical protein
MAWHQHLSDVTVAFDVLYVVVTHTIDTLSDGDMPSEKYVQIGQ